MAPNQMDVAFPDAAVGLDRDGVDLHFAVPRQRHQEDRRHLEARAERNRPGNVDAGRHQEVHLRVSSGLCSVNCRQVLVHKCPVKCFIIFNVVSNISSST